MNNKVQIYKIPQLNAFKMFEMRIYCAKLMILTLFCTNSLVAQKNAQQIKPISTVCIDAGHGGKDPGCHGASVNEKKVCLSMALKLGAQIKKAYPEIKVLYTRDKDVFVELDERAKFANRNKADLFICIHANAAGSGSAKGTETYVLGLHRTNAQEKIMQRENSSIYLEDDKGEKYKNFNMTPDAIIAKQLQLAIYLDQSISFASKLQGEFKSIERYDRGVKQAGFIVLYKTTMPSVLIETGFLTNLSDETFLKKSENQDKMATAMFKAFKKYKNELEGIQAHTKGVTKKKEDDLANKEKEVKKEDGKIQFSVQIETSGKKVSLTTSRFKGLDVFEYRQDNFYKYAIGEFMNDYKAANNYKNKMREKGFQHAFVIAFQKGKRIPLDRALKIIKK